MKLLKTILIELMNASIIGLTAVMFTLGVALLVGVSAQSPLVLMAAGMVGSLLTLLSFKVLI